MSFYFSQKFFYERLAYLNILFQVIIFLFTLIIIPLKYLLGASYVP